MASDNQLEDYTRQQQLGISRRQATRGSNQKTSSVAAKKVKRRILIWIISIFLSLLPGLLGLGAILFIVIVIVAIMNSGLAILTE